MADDRVRVIPLPVEIIDQFHDGGVNFPVVVYGGVLGNQVLGAGGLGWIDGRCIMWFDLLCGSVPQPIMLVRWARRMLRHAGQLGETAVFVYRDERQPKSERLLKLLGFEYLEMDEAVGKEVYKCLV